MPTQSKNAGSTLVIIVIGRPESASTPNVQTAA